MGNIMTIGIIGVGFVGNAVLNSLKNQRLEINDPAKGYNSTYDVLKTCEAIFVCVPSPSKQDGSCDTSILEDVLQKLKDYRGVILSKVTAPPGVYSVLQEKYPQLIYIPEFLTANNASDDYAKTKKFIIGGNVLAYQNEAVRIMKYSHNAATFSYCTIEEASFVKYTINAFLAIKVSFMNEMYDVAEAANLAWDTVENLVMFVDRERIGSSHMSVPGPDGSRGFGGMCFPKDTAGLLNYAKTIGIKMNILNTAIEKNRSLRNDI